jgi:hypothetical protein
LPPVTCPSPEYGGRDLDVYIGGWGDGPQALLQSAAQGMATCAVLSFVHRAVGGFMVMLGMTVAVARMLVVENYCMLWVGV